MDRAFALFEIGPALNYQESLDWLYGTQTFGIKLGLENTIRLLECLSIPPGLEGTKVIHVAGTNGKGSVCAFSERVLRDAGLRTGLFTSPHLVTYRERIRVEGRSISETEVSEGLTEIREMVAPWESHPTFFEISLGLAMQYFCRQGCEVIVLETGMGGRLDATTAVPSDVSVITSISLDHQQWLGETIRDIASEKAGILKGNVPVVIGALPPDARDVIGRRALELGIPCIEAHPIPDDWELGVAGQHQRENASLAVEAVCRIAGDRLSEAGIRGSLAETSWPGRFQRVGDDIILDGAHNPDAAEALRRTWAQSFPGEKARLVFGAVSSKDVPGIFRALLPLIESLVLVPVKSDRRLSVEEMRAAFIEAGGGGIPVETASTVGEAIEQSHRRGGRTLVAGSLFLVGEALALSRAEAFEVSLQ